MTMLTSDYHTRAAALLDREWRMLVDGKSVGALGGETYETVSPADGRVIARVPFAQRDDVARAVAAARRAAVDWRRTPVFERARRLQDFIDVLRVNACDLGVADAMDSGNPAVTMIGEVEMACENLEYFKGAALELKGHVLPSASRDWLLTRREPYGVVGRITAFNHPILFAAQKLGAPLMTGNTVVLKLPDQTPLAPLLMGELMRDIFPPGVVNIVSGDGPVTGDALVRHPDVKRLSLIGSVETGRRIQLAAAESGIKHVSLELGGKNPMIIFADADLAAAARAAVNGMNFTRSAGQSCGSTSRLFVHDAVYDDVLERIVEHVHSVRVGHPLDENTQMGALVSRRQLDKVLRYIDAGRAQGARLVYGGGPPPDPALHDGFYCQPTIFGEVTMSMSIAREEIFGPVLSIIRWRDRDDVVQHANELEYGLTASVWTRDLTTAFEMADALDSGYVWINGSAKHLIGAPFGGRKSSGIDSEESFEELLSYTQTKTINVGLE